MQAQDPDYQVYQAMYQAQEVRQTDGLSHSMFYLCFLSRLGTGRVSRRNRRDSTTRR